MQHCDTAESGKMKKVDWAYRGYYAGFAGDTELSTQSFGYV